MGLLDSLTSALGSNDAAQAGTHGSVIAAVIEYVNQQPGGFSGLVQTFEQNGLGGVIGSWIGHGENQPVSADQIQSTLGNDAIGAIAQKAGVSPDQVSGILSQVLPHLVDKATPDGAAPQGGALEATSLLGALGSLGGLFGKQA
ncbi:MAG TPA: YidB family protein [Pararobbsia sp.]|nr:YidB family protein [Pararobbsia sp.]